MEYMKAKDLKFDSVIIDECAQAPEVATWLAIVSGEKLIIAGDHLQLSYNTKSNIARLGGYQKSLLERMIESLPDWSKRVLTEQYRMNKWINEWPSKTFYKGKLTPNINNAERSLRSLAKPHVDRRRVPILRFIDTSQEDYSEINYHTSKMNLLEAAIIIDQVKYLLENYNLKQTEIGIITPYAGQVRLLREVLDEIRKYEVEVASVDGFQGREKEVILLSMIRSNPTHNLGFVADSRRINVAVTRAKRCIIMVGDKETLSANSLLRSLIGEFFQKKNASDIWELRRRWALVRDIWNREFKRRR